MGWNGSDIEKIKVERPVRGKKIGISFWPGAIAGLIILVGAGLVLCLMLNGVARPDHRQVAKSARSSRMRDVGTNVVCRKMETSQAAKPAETNSILVKRFGNSSNVPSDDTNRIHYASKSEIKVVGADGVERVVRSNPIFKRRIDNMLWAAIRPSGMPSGLNVLRTRMRAQTGSDEAFLTALRNQDIEISPEDPPHAVVAKKETLRIKEVICKELDNGRSFDDIFGEISETTSKERAYQSVIQGDMRKIRQSGDVEALRKYVQDMNPVMEEMGLRPLQLPSWAQDNQSNQ